MGNICVCICKYVYVILSFRKDKRSQLARPYCYCPYMGEIHDSEIASSRENIRRYTIQRDVPGTGSLPANRRWPSMVCECPAACAPIPGAYSDVVEGFVLFSDLWVRPASCIHRLPIYIYRDRCHVETM